MYGLWKWRPEMAQNLHSCRTRGATLVGEIPSVVVVRFDMFIRRTWQLWSGCNLISLLLLKSKTIFTFSDRFPSLLDWERCISLFCSRGENWLISYQWWKPNILMDIYHVMMETCYRAQQQRFLASPLLPPPIVNQEQPSKPKSWWNENHNNHDDNIPR